jgi:hypothetical protein
VTKKKTPNEMRELEDLPSQEEGGPIVQPYPEDFNGDQPLSQEQPVAFNDDVPLAQPMPEADDSGNQG